MRQIEGKFGMNNIGNIFQMLNQNPMQMLMQRFNIPQGLSNPQEIVNHLVKTGQVTQEQVNKAMQMSQMFKGVHLTK